MRVPVATLAAVLVLAACAEGDMPLAPGARAPEPAPSAGGAPAPSVEAPPPAPAVGRAEVLFEPAMARAVSSVREVHVDLVVSGVRGQGTLDVEFIAPGFMPYEKRSLVVRAQPSEQRSLRFTLPVAGTTVASSRLEGEWQVRFFLEGTPLTVAPFTLQP